MKTLILLLASLPAFSAIAYVNSSTKTDFVLATSQAATALNVTTGNMVIGCSQNAVTGDSLTMTDNASNTYTALAVQNRATDDYAVTCFYTLNATGNAALVLTLTSTGVKNFYNFLVLQYSGVATASALDVTNKGAKATSASIQSQAFTTATASQLIFAVTIGGLSVTSPTIAGVSANSRVNDSSDTMYAFDRIVSAIQTAQTADASCTAGIWGIAVFSFKAAGPAISGISSSNVTGYGARIEWTTSVDSTVNYIKYGTTSGMYPSTSDASALHNDPSQAHGWFMSALAPSTPYYYEVCSTANGSETCSTEQTLTTASAEAGAVTAPTAPTAASYTEPASFTDTFTVAAGCTDLQQVLTDTAALDGNNNYRVNIPSGETCIGRYTLPAKSGSNPSGTGYLLLTTDAVIPPSGARIDGTMLTNVPRIISNELAVEYYRDDSPVACSEIGQAWLDSDSTNPNAFLHWCTATTPTWTAVAMSSGTSLPGTCSVGAWFYDTDTADAHDRVSMCYETNKWLTYHIESTPGSFTAWAALGTADNAARWYVRGLRLERPYLPTSYTSLLPTSGGLGDQRASYSGCLAYTDNTNDRIIFDRIYFDLRGYPFRSRDTFCFFQGTNIAIINSYFNEPNYWRPSSGSLELTPNAIFMTESGGPWQIENNYFKNAHGITIFHGDDIATGMMTDGTIRRNTFYEDPADDCSGIASNGHCYYRRHMIEFKRASKVLIEGNVLNGGWPTINSGASVAWSPRAGASASSVGVLDINFKSNLIKFSPQPFLISGHNDYATYQNLASNRLAITNNVLYSSGTAADGSTVGWPESRTFNGQAMDIGLGIQNFNYSNNAIILPTTTTEQANMISHAVDWAAWPNSRIQAVSNIYTALGGTANQGYWGIQTHSSNRGTASLNISWLSGGAASYSVTGNAMQIFFNGAFEDDATYPTGNYRNATASNFTNALYQYGSDPGKLRPLAAGIMASGSATARGANGRDNGPDYDVFDVAQGATRGLRVLLITSSGATIYFTSPDETACTVEIGTSATPGTGDRSASSGGSRFQSAVITGLTTATLYHVRTYGGGCPVMVSTTFTTL